MDKLTDIDGYKVAAAGLLDLGVQYGLSLVSAIAILIAGFVIAGWASRTLHRRLGSIQRFDNTLVPVLTQTARYAILIFTFILVLAEFGVQTASIIAVLGAAGLAIGLALQGTLQNVAAGLMLLMLRPFHIGDFIATGSGSGIVEEIGIFITTMRTPQGVFVAIPNSQIWSDSITNFSRNPNRRIDLVIGISYDDDIDKARNLILGLAGKEERIQDEPAPMCFVKELGESSVDLELRAWTQRTEYWDVLWGLTRDSKYALDKAGITIPYPHRQVISVKT